MLWCSCHSCRYRRLELDACPKQERFLFGSCQFPQGFFIFQTYRVANEKSWAIFEPFPANITDSPNKPLCLSIHALGTQRLGYSIVFHKLGSIGLIFPSVQRPFSYFDLPSGKHTKNYGKSPFLMGKSTISMDHFQ